LDILISASKLDKQDQRVDLCFLLFTMIIFFVIYIFFFELPVILALESCSYWDAMMYFEAKIESGIFLPLLHTKGLPTFVKR
jgi:hypothetical protein